MRVFSKMDSTIANYTISRESQYDTPYIRIQYFLNFLFTFFITLATVFPPIRALGNINILLNVICMFLWCINSLCINPSFFKKPTNQRLFTFIFILYSIFVPYLLGNGVIGNRYLSIAQVFFFYIIYEFNTCISRDKDSWLIAKLSMPFILITLIKTGMGLLKNPYVSRQIKTSDAFSLNLLRSGIGGYEFIYLLVFISIIFFYFVFSKNKTKNNFRYIMYIFGFISVTSIILISNYLTAFLTVFMSIMVLFFIRLIKNKHYIILLIILSTGIIFLLIWKPLTLNILDWVSTWLGTGANYNKVIAIKEILINNTKSDIISSRYELLQISIEAFLKHPMYGLVIDKIQTSGGFLQGFGQHSHIIDTFALIGIIPGCIQIYILTQPFIKRLKKTKSSNDLVWTMLFAVLLVFNFNTAVPSLGYGIFFLFPLFNDSIENSFDINLRHKCNIQRNTTLFRNLETKNV